MPLVLPVGRNDDGTLSLCEGEEIRLTQLDVEHDSPFNDVKGSGVLYVTNQVIWIPSDAKGTGKSYKFRDISMHAVASESFDRPCLYCHLDTEELTVIRFTPNDSNTLQIIYNAFCKGAAENPDSDEEEPVDAWISAAMEEKEEEGQFDDA